MDKDALIADAEALESVADAAAYLGGLAEQDDVNQSAVSAKQDSDTMRRWAGLLRNVAETL